MSKLSRTWHFIAGNTLDEKADRKSKITLNVGKGCQRQTCSDPPVHDTDIAVRGGFFLFVIGRCHLALTHFSVHAHN